MTVIGTSQMRMGSIEHGGVLVLTKIREDNGWDRTEVLDTATGRLVSVGFQKEIRKDIRRRAKRSQTGRG